MRRVLAATVLLAGVFFGGCTREIGDPVTLLSAEYTATSVIFQFDVSTDRPWAWLIKLDTDQAVDPSGKKTGYERFGSEFEIKSSDRGGDSVAVRPTSGPVDPSPAAGGWPLPVGYAKLDGAATVSLAVPKAVLADDGLLNFEIWVYNPDDGGLYSMDDGTTTPRPDVARLTWRARESLRRRITRAPG